MGGAAAGQNLRHTKLGGVRDGGGNRWHLGGCPEAVHGCAWTFFGLGLVGSTPRAGHWKVAWKGHHGCAKAAYLLKLVGSTHAPQVGHMKLAWEGHCGCARVT